MTEALQQLILKRAPNVEVRAQAIAEGMITLREDGLRKVAMGKTTVEELLRVVA